MTPQMCEAFIVNKEIDRQEEEELEAAGVEAAAGVAEIMGFGGFSSSRKRHYGE